MIDNVHKFANLLDSNRTSLISLLHTESHKTIADANSEVREAIDFCTFYANEAVKLLPANHLGVIGERNITYYPPRGKWLTINPWNFPLAILVGQTIAPYIVGNTVTMKSASRTPKIAKYIHSLMHRANMDINLTFNKDILLTDHFNGVSFTGSHDTAKIIQKTLASEYEEIVPLIAETSGLNYAIIDSSVLLEQTVKMVAESAFNSNGQRCSSTRQLLIQEEISAEFISLLREHLSTWNIGSSLDSDYNGEEYQITEGIVNEEIFGPNLQWTTFCNKEDALNVINASGYGLTLGIHSRVESFCNYFSINAKVGNIYINRNQIGAVVESQPFGGIGLSGTGPKAGGIDYLKRFVYEKTVSTNLTAFGGNIELLSN